MKKISIVTPCYNEFENIDKCYSAIKKLFNDKLKKYSYEHIFCDNHSSDGTQKKLRLIAKKDKKVKVILNARNFGEQKSNLNGIINTTGDGVLLYFPADLQDPPKLIVDFIKYWEQGYDLVYGSRKKRKENFILSLCRKLFYQFVNIGSNNVIPSDISDYQFVDKKIINEIKKIEDMTPFLRSLPFFITDNYKKLEYEMEKRQHGSSKFSLLSLIDYALNGLLNISYTPFRVILFIGFIISLFSIFLSIFWLVQFLYYPEDVVKGIPLIITAMFLFFGIQTFLMGIIGEYLVSIHKQVKRKETVIEKEKINF
ncbi:MAG: putative glycosyltransferase [Alphaproteobacteria bacterium MarineAlpha5_Bin8]|nr:MAG: putative glycosyltransferase [Alphaproteobacteria bacterium MarineAlpha5_Bin8]PPR54152.1 MAG: putative glycosyltransferase [Alphaproteobacteria bacterium MarineAlpha5_Bin6]|tara:strand:- start:1522 stop:2457 length:936 start_codon:yes stop_codon:yes gene_type:complete